MSQVFVFCLAFGFYCACLVYGNCVVVQFLCAILLVFQPDLSLLFFLGRFLANW